MPIAEDIEQVTIGDVTMSGDDEHGVTWELNDLSGWWDGYEKSDSERVVHLGSTLLADSWDDATMAWERLLSSIPVTDLRTMTVFTGAGAVPAQQAEVRQHERPNIARRYGGEIEFSLSFVAPDPRRYSTVLQTTPTGLPRTVGGLTLPITLPISIGATLISGRVAVVNAGNTDSPPLLSITGPCPAATITHLRTGRRLFVADAIDTGRTLTIDTADQTALLDGTTLRTVTGSWWHLDPGVNQIAFSATAYDAGALLTIAHRSAWR